MNVVLKPGRERSLLHGHPWVFSGAIQAAEGAPAAGETVEIVAADGAWLGRGAWSPASQIRVRVWTRTRGQAVDEALLGERVRAALARRACLGLPGPGAAYREVHAESDGLPGFIVDRYADYRVAQFTTAGAERWRQALLAPLAGDGECRGIYERSDADVRGLEGLPPRCGPLAGDEPPDRVEIDENGLRFLVDLRHGHKTGFYLDQRENRAAFRARLTGGDVLNAFAYTGAFSVAALAAGAVSVLSIESSAAAIELGRENVRLNGFSDAACEWIEGDVFAVLRQLRDRGRAFDGAVLDPPRFAAVASQAARAARGYKDVNLLAFKLLRPGGLLFTFSCSGGVDADLFQKIVAGAARDAGVQARIIGWLAQPPDHAVDLQFPEGRYLKGLVCRVDGPAA